MHPCTLPSIILCLVHVFHVESWMMARSVNDSDFSWKSRTQQMYYILKRVKNNCLPSQCLPLNKIPNVQSSSCLVYGEFNINNCLCYFWELARFMWGAGVGLKLMTSFADRISANILSTTRVQTLWLLWAVKVFSWPLACYAKFWEKMHKYQN